MALGFFVDVSGVSSFLQKKQDGKVMSLFYALGNCLHAVGDYSSRNNLGRLFAYQMGDGFMVQYDNVKYSPRNCKGNADTMARLAIVLVLYYLVKHQGVLKVGLAEGDFFGLSESGYKFVKQENVNHGSSFRCGQGLIYLLPVTGNLLARAYGLTTRTYRARRPEYYIPQVLVESNLYKTLSISTTAHLEPVFFDRQKIPHWGYFNIVNPGKKVLALYNQVWGEDLDKEKILQSLQRYQAVSES